MLGFANESVPWRLGGLQAKRTDHCQPWFSASVGLACFGLPKSMYVIMQRVRLTSIKARDRDTGMPLHLPIRATVNPERWGITSKLAEESSSSTRNAIQPSVISKLLTAAFLAMLSIADVCSKGSHVGFKRP